MGRDFYISGDGDDSHDGRSAELAWNSLDRANVHVYENGDRLLLAGGHTFRGALKLHNVKASFAPVVISSFGEGRARIDGGRGSGIVLENCDGVEVTNIEVVGDGRKSGNDHGVGVHINHCDHVSVDHVEVSGFQNAGVAVEGSRHIRITHVLARENGFAGITTGGDQNRDVYIGYSRAINNPGDPTITDNHSGSGICLYAVAGALVEYCEAAENGWDMQQVNWNGPVGIWTAVGADSVVIQFCISHHNKSTKGDGGGFDFDGGTTNSVMQYNYSYQNGGCGYLLCQYEGGALWKNNTVRYCISENDGLTDHRAGFFTYMGEILYDCHVYHNVVVNQDGRNCVHGAPAGSQWYNNLFLLQGEGKFLHQVEPGTGLFGGNCYWRLDGVTDMDGFSSIHDWRQSTGHETFGEEPVGMQVDPQIPLPPSDAIRPTDPTQLDAIPWYRLAETSPLARAGLNLRELFGIHPGERDFFGRPLPVDGSTIGVSEV